MTSKLLTLLHSKIAAAVVGVLLVGGSGAAVVAANHGQIPFSQSAATATHTLDAHASDSSHAHAVSINGKLTTYDASAKTIAVRATGATSSTAISVDGNTRINGEHATALADLTNAIGHDVQVQADKQSDGTLLAWKITVQGDDSNPGNGNGNGNGSGNSGHTGQHQIAGTIASIGTASFTVTLADGTSKTVTISASTQFAGTAHSFKDLKRGMRVSIQGSDQADGTFAATQIEVTGAAGALSGLREAHPSVAFADALEARLLAHIASAGAVTSTPTSALADEPSILPSAPIAIAPSLPRRRAPTRAPRHMSRRLRFLWPTVAAAVLLLALGTLTVAASAGPGSLLYGLHRAEQGVRVALSGNPADRMRLHLGYASDALSAAHAAARAGDDATYGDALATLRSELAAATSELTNVSPGADHDTLAAQLSALRRRAAASLRADLPPLSWAERLATTDALAELGSAVPRVTSATAQREQNPATHTWHVVITGIGFAPGARLLVNGQPAGTVVSVSTLTLIAEYTAADGQPAAALGVANPDDTAAQIARVTIIPPGQEATPGPAATPGAGGNHGSGSGKGGRGGDHPPTPTPGG